MTSKPLTFEEWKGSIAPSFNDEYIKSFKRLHELDYKEEFENMLRTEYQNYVDDFNGNWLLK